MTAITSERTPAPHTSREYRGSKIRAGIGKVALYTILILGCFVTLVPFLWMVSTSLKPDGALLVTPPELMGQKISLARPVRKNRFDSRAEPVL